MAPPGIPQGITPGIPPGMPPAISLSESGNFMVIDRVAMGLIPVCSWRQVQQPLANRTGIREAVVE